MQYLLLVLSFFFTTSYAHEIQTTTQYINIKKQNQNDDVGFQQDLNAKINFNRQFDFGLYGTYLERFSSFEKSAGASVFYRPQQNLTFEFKYLNGRGNEVLPEDLFSLNTYYSLIDGLSPFLLLRRSQYSQTNVNSAHFGIEVEKIPNIIFIPQVILGTAKFRNPSNTDSIYSYGFRGVYYQEGKFNLALFAFKGREASQGVIGSRAILIDTLTGGVAYAHFLGNDLKAEIVIDHTDYDSIKTQFLTTTINLTWMF